jgi:hypothetical protein
MRDLLARIPSDVFWTAVIFWGLGMFTAWRFARHYERMRDAINHARHHYERALSFTAYVKDNVVAMIYAGAVFVAVVSLVGTLAWMRISGS